jgi:hypothetical protein
MRVVIFSFFKKYPLILHICIKPGICPFLVVPISEAPAYVVSFIYMFRNIRSASASFFYFLLPNCSILNLFSTLTSTSTPTQIYQLLIMCPGFW